MKPAFKPSRVLMFGMALVGVLVIIFLLLSRDQPESPAATDIAPTEIPEPAEVPVNPRTEANGDGDKQSSQQARGKTPDRQSTQPSAQPETQAGARAVDKSVEADGPVVKSTKKSQGGAGSVTRLKTGSGTKYIISMLDEPAGDTGVQATGKSGGDSDDAFASGAASALPHVRHDRTGAATSERSVVEIAGSEDVPAGGNSSLAAPGLRLEPVSIKTFRFSWADVKGETEYRLWEKRNRASGYRQVATLPADTISRDLEVFLPRRVNAQYLLQACNRAGCANSAALRVGGSLVEAVGYVKASNTGSEDRFGHSVAISGDGNTLAVGAPWRGIDAGGGAVYIFARKDGNWIQQAYMKAPGMRAGDHFGWSMSLSNDGDTLAVSAIGEDAVANGLNGHRHEKSRASGEVYIYTRRAANAWSRQAYVQPSSAGLFSGEVADSFGVSVTLSGDGNTLAVGADGEDSPLENSGAVYLFERRGASWNQQARIKASNPEAEDHFGWSVSLSNNGGMLAVGAIGEDSAATGIGGNQSDNTATNSGAVYVYTRDGNWVQQAYVKASNTRPGDLVTADEFGWAVALSGDGATLAVGARFEDSLATGVNGDQRAISRHSSGAVYVYTRGGNNWTQQAYVKASNSGWGDEFGSAVALSSNGNTLAVGAVGEDSSASGIDGDGNNNMLRSPGAAYVYTRGDDSWFQQAYVKASNTGQAPRSPKNAFGFAVALSDAGDILAVGAPEEDSAATGINGYLDDSYADSSGAVYLY